MSVRRILLAFATLLSTLAVVGTATGAAALASPQVRAATVATARAPQFHAVPHGQPAYRAHCPPATCLG